MTVNFHTNKDIEEIFLHIKKLKAEYGLIEEIKKKESNNDQILQNNKEKVVNEIVSDNISPDDIFEIVELEESVSKMNLKTSSICDLCGQDIILDENLSGLVLLNRFFACEECCKDASNDTLNNWIETRKAKTEEVKPVALWLMQIMHKTQLI